MTTPDLFTPPKTQSEMILEHLRAGNSLTVLDALRRFGCYALSQRIGEMKRAGYPIDSKMIAVSNGKRVAQYTMKAPERMNG